MLSAWLRHDIDTPPDDEMPAFFAMRRHVAAIPPLTFIYAIAAEIILYASR